MANLSCFYPTDIRGEACLAAGQGAAAAREFQKILDHSGLVWNCWTGALARLGIARANAGEAKSSQGADADAARVRSLIAYHDFLELGKSADPGIPIYKAAQSEYERLRYMRSAFFPVLRKPPPQSPAREDTPSKLPSNPRPRLQFG